MQISKVAEATRRTAWSLSGSLLCFSSFDTHHKDLGDLCVCAVSLLPVLR